MARAWGDLHSDLERLLRSVAAEIILPRFRALQDHQVYEKSPGELVTIVDREAEPVLAQELLALVPGSRVVGEEAAAEDPRILDGLDQGLVWLVDPLDGTANFVNQSPNFATMVALLSEGETVWAWIYQPVHDVLAAAEHGAGASMNGAPLRVPHDGLVGQPLRGAISRTYLPEDLGEQLVSRAVDYAEIWPAVRCSGVEYPAIARGERDFGTFWRTLPWDHAPGVLILEEAGGWSARFDGARYRPAIPGAGLVVARSPSVGRSLLERLLA